MKIAVAGGGAAGFFGAISAAESNPHASVTLFEATSNPLDKVRISGGGRCNVTHACFEPRELARSYPRGGRELIGPFTRFQPNDTVQWFESRGVRLKREEDGRMFPITDSSETIVNCLRESARKAGVFVRLNARIAGLVAVSVGKDEACFDINISEHGTEKFDRVLLATGSSPQGYRIAQSLGHRITPLAPSLFTFKIKDPRLEGLSGLSVLDVSLRMEVNDQIFEQQGPLLITHWGLSGPAVLKLSAWGARSLKEAGYKAKLHINWLGQLKTEDTNVLLEKIKGASSRRKVCTGGPEEIPRRLWERIVAHAEISDDTSWANLTRHQMQVLTAVLANDEYHIAGKGQFKDEFVTCGGVDLKEVDFKTMQSRLQSGLFFAGEILDIDGITGGFNFQSAWTTGWIAGHHIGQR